MLNVCRLISDTLHIQIYRILAIIEYIYDNTGYYVTRQLILVILIIYSYILLSLKYLITIKYQV